jgi:CheY-like chemotaxis protein
MGRPCGPARILIVDDHPVTRLGLRQLIETEPDLTVCGEADTFEGTIEAMRTLDPDLVIVDLATTDGVELVRRLRADHPVLRLLVCSMHDEALFAHLTWKAGADGYVTKQAAPLASCTPSGKCSRDAAVSVTLGEHQPRVGPDAPQRRGPRWSSSCRGAR